MTMYCNSYAMNDAQLIGQRMDSHKLDEVATLANDAFAGKVDRMIR